MGLDMYIKKASKEVTSPNYDNTSEVGYWRKFNALHKWFVDNCQDGIDECQYALVTKEKLTEVVEILKSLNADNCDQLLPSASGFFFGSTDYDDWYWQDVNDAIDQISKILEETDWGHENIYYHSSW